MGRRIGWNKIFSIRIFVKGLVFRIYFKNQSYKSTIKDWEPSRMGKTLEQVITKKISKWLINMWNGAQFPLSSVKSISNSQCHYHCTTHQNINSYNGKERMYQMSVKMWRNQNTCSLLVAVWIGIATSGNCVRSWAYV